MYLPNEITDFYIHSFFPKKCWKPYMANIVCKKFYFLKLEERKSVTETVDWVHLTDLVINRSTRPVDNTPQ